MRGWTSGLALVALVLGMTGTAVQEPETPPADDRLHSVLWVQSAVEYRALTRQIWRQVETAIEAGRDNPRVNALVGSTRGRDARPPAIVVDVDETVLDNAPYEARLVQDGADYAPKSWAAWVKEAQARPVPGALNALTRAAAAGVAVFYVTNRDAALEEPTRQNLARWGFPIDPRRDVVMMKNERPEWTSDKSSRRAFVAKTHRIIALVGDDFGDFMPGAREGLTMRRELAEEHDARWGRSWFVLPNPMYGSWERSLYDFKRVEGVERRRAMQRGLEPLRLPVEATK
jgi:5'-nucleotidase (lipoprotein e(P4) family)